MLPPRRAVVRTGLALECAHLGFIGSWKDAAGCSFSVSDLCWHSFLLITGLSFKKPPKARNTTPDCLHGGALRWPSSREVVIHPPVPGRVEIVMRFGFKKEFVSQFNKVLQGVVSFYGTGFGIWDFEFRGAAV